MTQKAKKATKTREIKKKGSQNTQYYEQKLDRQFPLKVKTKIKISGTNEREYSKNLPLKSYDKSSTYQFFSKKKRYDDGMKRDGAKLPMFGVVVFIRTHKRRILLRLSEFAIYTEELFKKPKRNKNCESQKGIKTRHEQKTTIETIIGTS